jgi:hypothetical protein
MHYSQLVCSMAKTIGNKMEISMTILMNLSHIRVLQLQVEFMVTSPLMTLITLWEMIILSK